MTTNVTSPVLYALGATTTAISLLAIGTGLYAARTLTVKRPKL